MLFLANNFQEGTYLLHWLWVELDFSEILVVVVIIVRQPVTLNINVNVFLILKKEYIFFLTGKFETNFCKANSLCCIDDKGGENVNHKKAGLEKLKSMKIS